MNDDLSIWVSYPSHQVDVEVAVSFLVVLTEFLEMEAMEVCL